MVDDGGRWWTMVDDSERWWTMVAMEHPIFMHYVLVLVLADLSINMVVVMVAVTT